MVRFLVIDAVNPDPVVMFQRGLSDHSHLSASIGHRAVDTKSPGRIPSWNSKSKIFREHLDALLSAAKLLTLFLL